MKPRVEAWIEKAEGDFITAQRSYRARKYPNYDGVCFWSEQCVEKYMKAFMLTRKIPFSKFSYNLIKLMRSIAPSDPEWKTYREDFKTLMPFGNLFRSPSESADKATAKD